MMQCENCEHEFENENCTNCANGLPCSAYECAKTQGRLKEYCHTKAEEIHNKHYQKGRADAIDFVVRQIIYPLLNEYDIQLWKDIEYIELADKWVEFVGKYKGDDEPIINELVKWILEQLKGEYMNTYNVSIMVPISTNVEANSFKEAIEKAFNKLNETANYGGDGIFVTNIDTGETYEE